MYSTVHGIGQLVKRLLAARRAARHNPANMGWGERKYTDEQKEAVIFAKNVRRFTGKAIANLAAKGELESPTGAEMEPFSMPPNTIYSLARKALAKSHKTMASELVNKPPADANEAIRQRLVEIADRKTKYLVDQARRKPKEIDTLETTRLARMAREVAALPAYGLRAPQPGRPSTGAPEGESVARNNEAAAIYAAAKGGQVEPAQSDPIQEQPVVPDEWEGEVKQESRARLTTVLTEGQQTPRGTETPQDDGDEEGPGTRARAELTRMLPSV